MQIDTGRPPVHHDVGIGVQFGFEAVHYAGTSA